MKRYGRFGVLSVALIGIMFAMLLGVPAVQAAGPDLVVTAIEDLPSSIVATNNAASLTYTVTNQGDAASSVRCDSFYLSPTPDLEWNSDWQSIPSSYNVSGIAAGGSATYTKMLDLYSINQAGSYYLIVELDTCNNNHEFDESNNKRSTSTSFALTIPPKPDLVITTIEDLPSTIVATANAFTLRYTVENQGDIPSSERCDSIPLLYEDTNTVRYTGITCGLEPIEPGESRTYERTYDLSAINEANDYYVSIWLNDALDANKENDFGRTTTFTLIVPPRADLVITAIEDLPSPIEVINNELTVSYTVLNQGEAASEERCDEILIEDSDDGDWVIQPYIYGLSSIEAGSSQTYTSIVDLSEITEAGNYYLRIFVDACHDVPELDDWNNGGVSNTFELIMPTETPTATPVTPTATPVTPTTTTPTTTTPTTTTPTTTTPTTTTPTTTTPTTTTPTTTTPTATPVTPTATPVTPTATPVTPTATPITPTATPEDELCDPQIAINYDVGAPGSSFTVTGTCYPAQTGLNLLVNGAELDAGESGPRTQAIAVSTDALGRFAVILKTSAGAELGLYQVSVADAATGQAIGAATEYVLDDTAPVRTEEPPSSGPAPVEIVVPTEIEPALRRVYLPFVGS